MSNILFFNIPAHGHTNPTVEVVRTLVCRGHRVRYYSFSAFQEKLEAAGAEVVLCDDAMPPAPGDLDQRVGRDFALLMEMVVAVTEKLHDRIAAEIEAFCPDCIVTDSVCIWGKLFARRFGIPMVCSTTTLAFNRYTAKLMKQSLADVLLMIAGMPQMMKALRRLETLGYEPKGMIELLQNDNETDTIVYTSRMFQPMAETFSERYAFVGPSVRPARANPGAKERPLVYISLGTVLNKNCSFYKSCMEALCDLPCDAIMSVGMGTDMSALGNMPANFSVYPRVNQMDVLGRADLFISHCGMNSAMESLYCGVPMVCFPQHAEERAVANRVIELGAGTMLGRATKKQIRKAVMDVLGQAAYRERAQQLSEDMRNCSGFAGAADHIEMCAKSGK